MDSDLTGFILLSEFPIEDLFALLQLPEFVPDKARVTVAAGDEGKAAFDRRIYFVEFLLNLALPLIALLVKPLNLGLELSNEGLDEFLIAHENGFKTGHHPVFEDSGFNTDCALAGAALLFGRAVVTLAIDDRHGTTASATYSQACQQALFGLAFVPTIRGITCLNRLNLVPDHIINDAKVRNIVFYPFMLGVWLRHPLTGLGVFDKPLTVIDDAPEIKLVVEDAIAPLSTTVDGRRIPGSAATSSSRIDLPLSPNGVNLRPENADLALFGDSFALD